MQRRNFLLLSGISISFVTLGLYERGIWFNRSVSLTYWSLPHSVKAIYDSRFESALSELSTEQLLMLLRIKGVIRGNEFIVQQVSASLVYDRVIEFEQLLYTETELALYVLVARLHSQSILSHFA